MEDCIKRECSCGAVIYKKDDEGLKYLIIRDRNDNYGLPKGHTEEGETFKETALREIKEEVGLDVELDEKFIYSFDYPIKEGKVLKSVHYFLADMKDQEAYINDGEASELLLLPYDEAVDIATFAQTKDLLKEAHEYLERNNSL